jgi:hypothetical protein
MTLRGPMILAALLLGCGGHGAPSGPGAQSGPASSQIAVQQFLRAVADSNIDAMGQLWGTSGGPAAVTGQPPDYVRRLMVTQVFLRGAPYKILHTEPVSGDANHEVVTVQLDRGQCKRAVPFTTVKTSSHGWIVNAVDLNQAGTPGRPCENPPAVKPSR